MTHNRLAWTALVLAAFSAAAANAPAVRLHAAGSLRAAMTEMAKAYSEAYGVTVTPTFGGSGLLKERLLTGEPGDVFASADMGNPQALTNAGKSGPTVLFAHNHLCAILRPGLKATPTSLLATLLSPSIKVGTSALSDKAPARSRGASMVCHCGLRRARWAAMRSAISASPASAVAT